MDTGDKAFSLKALKATNKNDVLTIEHLLILLGFLRVFETNQDRSNCGLNQERLR
jgi:hypothetical protein